MLKKHESLNRGFAPIVIAIVIGVIAVGVAGGVYVMRRSSAAPAASTSTNTESQVNANPSPAGELSGTIPEIVTRGQNLECDWRIPSDAGANLTNSGKLWTAGGRGRSQITATSGSMSFEGNAVYKDNTVYGWFVGGGVKTGFKFTQADLARMDSGMTAEQKQQAQQIKAQMLFNCKPWTPDESKFVLPSDIEFKSN